MDKTQEALKLALEALEIGHEYAVETAENFHIEMAGYKQQRHDAMDAEVKQIADAITAIREALAEPKEKYQYGTPLLDAMTGKTEQPANVAAVNTSPERVDKTAENVHEQPAQQQEPKRWAVFCQGCRKEWSVSYPHPGKSICADCDDKLAQYDTSPQPAQPSKPWVGLSTDEMKEIADRYHLKPPNVPVAFRAIEAKLREKNA